MSIQVQVVDRQNDANRVLGLSRLNLPGIPALQKI